RAGHHARPRADRSGHRRSADPLRAASQCAGALLRVESPGGEGPGSIQLVAAVTRLVNAAVRAGLPAADAVAILAR
ncbi:MAG TPA: hypothetical protein VFN45_18250, partial [Myxococcaceae bacterium]|nr:hypothetical protein [Myxococcaceae bacterium]